MWGHTQPWRSSIGPTRRDRGGEGRETDRLLRIAVHASRVLQATSSALLFVLTVVTVAGLLLVLLRPEAAGPAFAAWDIALGFALSALGLAALRRLGRRAELRSQACLRVRTRRAVDG